MVKTVSGECIPQFILWDCQCPQVTKNYIMKFESPLLFCLWLDGINSRFKSHLVTKPKGSFYKERVPESKCRRKKTVDKDILITYGLSDRKCPQPIITTSDIPQELNGQLFYKLLANAMWIERKGWIKK